MERFFKLKENKTTIKTEIIAGLTTFMTTAYIVALNPNILTDFGNQGAELWNAVFLATILSAGIGSIIMGLLANKPFVMAPGMGLNSFFALVVTNIVSITGMTYLQSFRAALVIIFIEGMVFTILSLLRIREKIVEAIPLAVRLGIGPAIGLMLMNIGFGSNVSIYTETNDYTSPMYVMRDFFGSLTADYAQNILGSKYEIMVISVITMFIGVFLIIALDHRRIKGSVLFGMIGASVFYWICQALVLKTNPFENLSTASFVPPLQDLADSTLFKVDFASFFSIGYFTAITLIVTFCIIDMFDTIGTLVGTASKAGFVDENGKMPQMKEALISDAMGTLIGSVTGTSTVTTVVESTAGVAAGGRTGLTAIVSGIMFLLCMFIAPLAAIIPAAATSSALIYVGILMFGNIRKIDLEDTLQMVPVVIMLLAVPISGSIGHGIGLALISYSVIAVCIGKAKQVSALTFVLALLFIIKFFLAL